MEERVEGALEDQDVLTGTMGKMLAKQTSPHKPQKRGV